MWAWIAPATVPTPIPNLIFSTVRPDSRKPGRPQCSQTCAWGTRSRCRFCTVLASVSNPATTRSRITFCSSSAMEPMIVNMAYPSASTCPGLPGRRRNQSRALGTQRAQSRVDSIERAKRSNLQTRTTSKLAIAVQSHPSLSWLRSMSRRPSACFFSISASNLLRSIHAIYVYASSSARRARRPRAEILSIVRPSSGGKPASQYISRATTGAGIHSQESRICPISHSPGTSPSFHM